jgi:hypothetical protein
MDDTSTKTTPANYFVPCCFSIALKALYLEPKIIVSKITKEIFLKKNQFAFVKNEKEIGGLYITLYKK